jgi:hypothetical protein
MATPIGTIARTAVVLGVVGYCAWPGDDSGSNAAGKPSSKPLEIAASQLTPTIQAPPKRNPFRAADAPPFKFQDSEQVAGATPRNGTATSATAKASSKTVRDGTAVSGTAKEPSKNARGSTGTSATVSQGTKSTSQKTDAVDPLAGLVLNATSVRDNYCLAMINGRLYERGQPLKLSDPSTPQMVVQEVFPHKVLLRYQERLLVLDYSRKPIPASNAKGSKPAAQPSRPAALPTATARRPSP